MTYLQKLSRNANKAANAFQLMNLDDSTLTPIHKHERTCRECTWLLVVVLLLLFFFFLIQFFFSVIGTSLKAARPIYSVNEMACNIVCGVAFSGHFNSFIIVIYINDVGCERNTIEPTIIHDRYHTVNCIFYTCSDGCLLKIVCILFIKIP